MPNNNLTPDERRRLREYLSRRFSLSELETLAFDLGINSDSLPHNTLPDFARELIAYCQRTDQTAELIRAALSERPDAEIAQLLSPPQPTSSPTAQPTQSAFNVAPNVAGDNANKPPEQSPAVADTASHLKLRFRNDYGHVVAPPPAVADTASPDRQQEMSEILRSVTAATVAVSGPRSQVFISYSHKDAAIVERLQQTHLKPLVRAKKLELWVDTRLEGGDEWRREIAAALAITKVAVLLVSGDFFASDFIDANELPILREAARQGQVKLLPLYVGPCNPQILKESTLSEYQGVNSPSNFLYKLQPYQQDEILIKLAERLDNLMMGN